MRTPSMRPSARLNAGAVPRGATASRRRPPPTRNWRTPAPTAPSRARRARIGCLSTTVTRRPRATWLQCVNRVLRNGRVLCPDSSLKNKMRTLCGFVFYAPDRTTESGVLKKRKLLPTPEKSKKPKVPKPVNKPSVKRCAHGRQKAYCRECGGSAFCVHDKQKAHCPECRGCEHGNGTGCTDCIENSKFLSYMFNPNKCQYE